MTDSPDRDRSQNYHERNRSYSRDRLYGRDRMYTEIGPIVGIDHETTIKMIIEMTIEKKFIGISKTTDMRKNKNYYKDTNDKENHRISHRNKDRSKDRYQNED